MRVETNITYNARICFRLPQANKIYWMLAIFYYICKAMNETYGTYSVSATKGGKTITAEVLGDLANKETLFARLMNRNKINLNDRHLWKLSETKLVKSFKEVETNYINELRNPVSQY
jgi:hypothetical protein